MVELTPKLRDSDNLRYKMDTLNFNAINIEFIYAVSFFVLTYYYK